MSWSEDFSLPLSGKEILCELLHTHDRGADVRAAALRCHKQAQRDNEIHLPGQIEGVR